MLVLWVHFGPPETDSGLAVDLVSPVSQPRPIRLSTHATMFLRFLGLGVASFLLFAIIRLVFDKSLEISVWAKAISVVFSGVPMVVFGLGTQLQSVMADEEGLELQWFWVRRRVPYARIERVRSIWLLGVKSFLGYLPLVLIAYKDDGRRRRAWFLPRTRMHGGRGREHPDVAFLRQRVEDACGHSAGTGQMQET